VRAVDEDGLLAHQGFGARIGQRVEQQRGIAGRRVRGAGRGAVEQLVAIHGPVLVHDGLARDDGQVAVFDVLLGRVDFGGGLFRGGRHGRLDRDRQRGLLDRILDPLQ